MKKLGFVSETYTTGYISKINRREDWNRVLHEEFRLILSPLRPYFAFGVALFRYDVFFISLDGFFLGKTPLKYLQSLAFRVAGKKTVVLPYGADGYVYANVRSTSASHGLQISYPHHALEQPEISKRVKYWIKNADAFIPGFMGFDGFGRWDVLIPSSLTLDLTEWEPTRRRNNSDGSVDSVVIAHAPNHRGFKGTEFVIEAVKTLQAEGLKIELRLLEGLQNEEVRRIFHEEVDILVEQLIYSGHGLNAIEGMASALPTISNLEDDDIIQPFRRWSFFGECPLVSATPENIEQVLRKLVTRPLLRLELGEASRKYTEKYFDLDSSQFLFSNVIDFVFGTKDTLINLYHPILGQYPNRSPKIQHPLINNRIVD